MQSDPVHVISVALAGHSDDPYASTTSSQADFSIKELTLQWKTLFFQPMFDSPAESYEFVELFEVRLAVTPVNHKYADPIVQFVQQSH